MIIAPSRQVLPAHVAPSHYTVALKPNFVDFVFDGEVDITSVQFRVLLFFSFCLVDIFLSEICVAFRGEITIGCLRTSQIAPLLLLFPFLLPFA
jgi:hypothetical protein